MYKKYKYLGITLIILLIIAYVNISSIQKKHTFDKNDKVYTIGINEERPYFYIDEKGEYRGYYYELISHISKALNVKFEYIIEPYKNLLNKLEKNEIDLLIGLYYTKERAEKITYLDYPICQDKSSIYVRDNSIKYIEDLNGKKLALVKDSISTEWIVNSINDRDIKAEVIYVDRIEEGKEMFKNSEVDAIFATTFDNEMIDYRKIHSSYMNYAYLAVSKQNIGLTNQITHLFSDYDNIILNPIKILSLKYFSLYSIEGMRLLKLLVLLFIVIFILFLGIFKLKLYSVLKMNKVKKRINIHIRKEDYIMYYQPIINSITNKVIGFESLIRLNDNGKVLAPNIFLQDIKESGMMDKLSLWIFERVLKDYQKIKSVGNFGDDFYISINISIKEIENISIYEEIKNIYKKYNVDSNYICFEITEDEKGHNLDIVRKNIDDLRKLGFKVAIDDFGTDYSNFSVLERFEFDIIKLDKYFIDNIENLPIKKAAIQTFDRFVHETDKLIVIEGVEEQHQIEYLKSLKSKKINIQGYYYCKPISVIEILNFEI